jgi:hypothetical protein
MCKCVSENPDFLVRKFLDGQQDLGSHDERVHVGRHDDGVLGNLEIKNWALSNLGKGICFETNIKLKVIWVSLKGNP